jgi:UDP-N-acetylmuramyl tripeptide synthase
VDEVIVERGDWTGPGAARLVLRRPEVEIAILESARGGLLRRGLAIESCDAALITNVTDDHLGEFGVADLATMARTKAVVAGAVRDGGVVVLNGEDPSLLALLPSLAPRVILFAIDARAPAIREHVARGGEAYVVESGSFARIGGRSPWAFARVDEAPITFAGAAVHNIANVLASCALAGALGLPDAAIGSGVRSFDAKDNPGRGQLVTASTGARVLTDFGHNPDGMRHLLALARALAAKSGGRLAVISAQAGDRRDEDLVALGAAIAGAAPDFVVLWDILTLLRGRGPGEVPALLKRGVVAGGVDADHAILVDTEIDALDRALAWARPDDLVVVAPNIDRGGVSARLAVSASPQRPVSGALP